MMKRMRQAFWLAVLVIVAAGCSRNGTASNREGIEYYEAENYEQALLKFNQAITQEGGVGEYYTNRGMTYLMLGQYEEARADFQEALQLSGETMQTHRGLGILCMAEGNYEEAIAEFDQAVSLTGTGVGDLDYDILQHKADAQVMMRDYNGAVETYTTLIQLDVEVNRNYIRRGILYLRGGSEYLQYVLEDFDSAILHDAADYEVYLNIYQILMEYGYEEEAAAYIDRAFELKAVSPKDYFEKGRIYFYMEEYELALHQFEVAVAQGITQAEYYIAKCAENQGDYETALSVYESLMTDEAYQTAESYNQLGLCMVMLGQYKEAEIHFQQAEALDDGTMRQYILWNEVIMYEKQKRFEEAYQVMLQYKEDYPLGERESKKLAYLRSRC